jgi:hypothetical protein
MSDEIIGIAILEKRLFPQRLACLCKPAGKPVMVQVLPVYAEGTPKPDTKNGAAWCYREQDGRLHFTPSVHILTQNWDERMQAFAGGMVTQFHNGYSWSVSFAEAEGSSEDSTWPTKHLYEQLREANPGAY